MMKSRLELNRLAAALIVMGLALTSVPASALDIVVDGYVGDWGVSWPRHENGNDWTPDSEVDAWWSEDWVGHDGYVGPGYGGQDFDVEAMYGYLDGSNLYIAIVTGFDQWGEDGIYPGAVFFDFGQDGYDAAVTTGTRSAGMVWTGTGDDWWLNPDPYAVDEPYTVDWWNADYIDQLDSTEFVYRNSRSNHNVIELVLELQDPWLTALQENGLHAQWTMGCGNDIGYIDLEAPIVPEPATMVLVGLGLAGAIVRRRFLA